MPLSVPRPQVPDPTQAAAMRRKETAQFAQDFSVEDPIVSTDAISRTPKPLDPLDQAQTDVSAFLQGTQGFEVGDQPGLEEAKKKAVELGYQPEEIEAYTQKMSSTPSPEAQMGISQPFGAPNARLYGYNAQGRANINRGVDMPMPSGTPQSAPNRGNWVVKSVQTGSYNSGWGNSVVIRNTQTGETIRRSHLARVLVKPGQKVTGQTLGTTGRTGLTTGYHADVEYTNSSGKLSDYTKSPYYQGANNAN